MTNDPFGSPAENETPEPEKDNRPIIPYEKGNGHIAVDDALGPLAATGRVYSRSEKLVQVLGPKEAPLADDIIRDEDSPKIKYIDSNHMWKLLSSAVLYSKYDARSKKYVPIDPPDKVVKAICSQGHWDHIKPLVNISTVPILRENGSVHQEPGYDEESGLYYVPNCPDPLIPGGPTRDDAEEAASELLEVVQDFPFAETFHGVAWLSVVLSRIARPIFEGGVPMFMVDANTRGTGKGLLVDAAAVLTTGLRAAKKPWVSDDDEMRKKITSALMAGDQMFVIDNIPAGFMAKWASLDCAITSGYWSDRVLGKNEQISLRMETQFFATGNNITVGGDAARRTLKVRLEAQQANPELRDDFDWYPLLPAIIERRPFLLGKAINIIRAYLLADRPSVGLSSIGSFEGWSDIVRSSMVYAGLPDPADAFATHVEGLDEETEALDVLLEYWSDLEDLSSGAGLTVTEILGQLERRNGDLGHLVEAVQTLCPTRDGSLPIPRRLARLFRSVSGRIRLIGGKEVKLKRTGSIKGGTATWQVVPHIKMSIRTKPIHPESGESGVHSSQDTGQIGRVVHPTQGDLINPHMKLSVTVIRGDEITNPDSGKQPNMVTQSVNEEIEYGVPDEEEEWEPKESEEEGQSYYGGGDPEEWEPYDGND
jgi:putative DNA primase/helicase